MKNLLTLFGAVIFLFVVLYSCGGGSEKKEDVVLKNKGEIVVLNGKDLKDTISYTCIGCVENLENMETLLQITNEATVQLKNKLNFPRSFIPQKIELTVIKEDSLFHYKTDKLIDNVVKVFVNYFYVASNAYGTEISGQTILIIYLKNNKIHNNLESEIRLENLYFKDDRTINRSFSATHSDSYININPVLNRNLKDISLIVYSSFTCVDKGAELTFEFEDKSTLNIYSWNDFNCDPVSYFELRKPHLDKLKEKNIRTIRLYSGRDLVMCWPPKNDKDYFVNLAKIKTSP